MSSVINSPRSLPLDQPQVIALPTQQSPFVPRATNRHVEPLPPGTKARPNAPQRIRRDLRTLSLFIRVYCHAKHEGQSLVSLKNFDLQEITGKQVHLCPDCSRLLHHAFIKRTACPRELKPDCKNCPTHCYSKAYRDKIREVMRFSGLRLFLTGRIDYLFHLFF